MVAIDFLNHSGHSFLLQQLTHLRFLWRLVWRRSMQKPWAATRKLCSVLFFLVSIETSSSSSLVRQIAFAETLIQNQLSVFLFLHKILILLLSGHANDLVRPLAYCSGIQLAGEFKIHLIPCWSKFFSITSLFHAATYSLNSQTAPNEFSPIVADHVYRSASSISKPPNNSQATDRNQFWDYLYMQRS